MIEGFIGTLRSLRSTKYVQSQLIPGAVYHMLSRDDERNVKDLQTYSTFSEESIATLYNGFV